MSNPIKEALESKTKVEETTDQPAPTDDKKPEESKLGEDESKQTDSTDEVDYKALLEQEQAKLSRAEEKIVKLKKDKKSKPEELDRAEEETEDVKDRLEELVKQQVSQIKDQVRGEIVESEVDDLLSEISSNVDEQQLIKHIYSNRLQRSGFTRSSIREDLINAKLLANKDVLLKSNKELSVALKSKSTTQSTPNFGSGTRETEKPKPNLSAEELAFLKRYGVKT